MIINNIKNSLKEAYGNYKIFWKKTFDFKSKANKKEWWTALIINSTITLTFPSLWVLTTVLTALSDFSQNIRRGNDLGWKVQNTALAIISPYVLMIAATSLSGGNLNITYILFLAAFLIYGITAIRLGFENSQNTQIEDNSGTKELDFFKLKEKEING